MIGEGVLPRATVLLSGGVDSVACAHLLQARGFVVDGLFVDFGQPASKLEHRAASSSAQYLAIPLHVASLSCAESFSTGEIVGRNAFLLFVALMLTRGKSDLVALGIHAGTPYYDNSGRFVASMEALVAEHTDGRVSFSAPFATWGKQDVYEYFRSARIPVGITYSCEAGTEPPCGVCLSCRDRKLL